MVFASSGDMSFPGRDGWSLYLPLGGLYSICAASQMLGGDDLVPMHCHFLGTLST